MTAFGAIAINIFAFVAVFLHRIGKHLLCPLDLHTNFGQISKFHGGTILRYQRLEIESIILKIIVVHVKTFLGKIEGLLHQVEIGIIHVLAGVWDMYRFLMGTKVIFWKKIIGNKNPPTCRGISNTMCRQQLFNYLTEVTRLLKESGSFIARSARILRSTVIPFLESRWMNSE